MRVASYILLGLVTAFLINAVASFVSPAYQGALRQTKHRIVGQSIVSEQLATSTGVAEQRIADSLDRLDKSIGLLASNSGTQIVSTVSASATGKVLSWSVAAPVTLAPQEPDIPVSGLLLAKLMPDITLKKTENSGIFDIFIFNKIRFTTYEDGKHSIKVYAFDEGYDTMLANLKLTSSVYSINETDQFFGYTFFLNPIKKDNTVRLVTALEWRAIGVEMPKKYYSTFKKLLLK